MNNSLKSCLVTAIAITALSMNIRPIKANTVVSAKISAVTNVLVSASGEITQIDTNTTSQADLNFYSAENSGTKITPNEQIVANYEKINSKIKIKRAGVVYKKSATLLSYLKDLINELIN